MRPTFNQIRNLGDPALTNLWDLQITKPPTGLSFDVDGLNFRCESVGIPKKSGSKISVQIRGLAPVHYPGTLTPEGSLTFNFTETEDNFITKIISDLTNLTQDSETGAGIPKAELEMEIKITRLNRQNKPIWEYNLVGCFMESPDPGSDLNGGDADVLKPSMTISYDNFTERSLI